MRPRGWTRRSSSLRRPIQHIRVRFHPTVVRSPHMAKPASGLNSPPQRVHHQVGCQRHRLDLPEDRRQRSAASSFQGCAGGAVTTTGRKTGEPRGEPAAVCANGNCIVLTPPTAGAANHPMWYPTAANPNVTVQIKDEVLNSPPVTPPREERAHHVEDGVDVHQLRRLPVPGPTG